MNIFNIEIDRNRVYGLDILRASAILQVVYGHSRHFLKEFRNDWITPAFPMLDGVSIFFVLSGFLIGRILINKLEKEGVGFKVLLNFWIRRWFRTLPNYFLILIVMILISLIKSHTFPDGIGYYFLFLQNIYTPHPEFFGEAWSLTTEEWFYLLLPIILYILMRIVKIDTKKAILTSIIMGIFLSTMIRVSRNSTDISTLRDWDILIRKQVITRLDSLMFGVLGAFFSYYYKEWWLRYKNITFGVGIILLILHEIHLQVHFHLQMKYAFFSNVLLFTHVSIGTLLLLPFLSNLKSGAGSFYKFISYVSVISYSMYLINFSLLMNFIIPVSFNFLFPNNSYLAVSILKFICFWFFTITGSILLFKYFEKPCMQLRNRIGV